jgi:hypothetical protein
VNRAARTLCTYTKRCILVITLIRLVVEGSSSADPTETDKFVFEFFVVLMVVLSICAIRVYIQMISLPMCQAVLALNGSECARSGSDRVHLRPSPRTWEDIKTVYAQIRPWAIMQFVVFFCSLVIWPGLPCSAELHGWFAGSGKLLFCSPFVIAAFNYGDGLGRALAGRKAVIAAMTLQRCIIGSSGRVVLLVLLILCVNPQVFSSTWLLLLVVFFIGLSNGLLCTIGMMKGPLTETVAVEQREIAAYIMVLALYLGIACGSVSGAFLNVAGVF